MLMSKLQPIAPESRVQVQIGNARFGGQNFVVIAGPCSIESEEQLSRLSAQGCDVVQGYLFSRPLSAADLLANNILGSKQRSEPRALRLIKS